MTWSAGHPAITRVRRPGVDGCSAGGRRCTRGKNTARPDAGAPGQTVGRPSACCKGHEVPRRPDWAWRPGRQQSVSTLRRELEQRPATVTPIGARAIHGCQAGLPSVQPARNRRCQDADASAVPGDAGPGAWDNVPGVVRICTALPSVSGRVMASREMRIAGTFCDVGRHLRPARQRDPGEMRIDGSAIISRAHAAQQQESRQPTRTCLIRSIAAQSAERSSSRPHH